MSLTKHAKVSHQANTTFSHIMQMAWAHSEHGHVLACASEDGLISIYQQDTGQSDDQGQWTQKAHLGASIQPITGIQFAPKQLGLQLATASEDGYVRFYQADRPLDANTWQLNNDLQVDCFAVLSKSLDLQLDACTTRHHEANSHALLP